MLALITWFILWYCSQFHTIFIQFWSNHNAATCTVIATLDSCVKQPVILRSAAATKMLAVRSYICGINIKTICHLHLSIAAVCSNQQHSTKQFELMLQKLPVCINNVLIYGCRRHLLELANLSYTKFHSPTTLLSALLFLVICLIPMAMSVSGTASGISWWS